MRQRECGFTLMETLIALVLMSLLMLALFGGFRAGVASWGVLERNAGRNDVQIQLGRMLYRHLGQVKLQGAGRSFFGTTSNDTAFVEAGRDVLHYVAPLSLSTGNQLYNIEISSNPGGRTGVWMRKVVHANLRGQDNVLEGVDYELLSQELTMQFSYFIDDEWVEELGEGVVPLLVRVDWHSGDRVWASSSYAVAGY